MKACLTWIWKFLLSIARAIVYACCKGCLSKPKTPTKFVVSVKSSSRARLRWRPVGGTLLNPNKYEVQYRVAGSGNDFETVYEGDEAQYMLLGLKPGCAYEARVRTSNFRDASAFSDPVKFSTLRLPGVGDGGSGPLSNSSSYNWTQTDNDVILTCPLPEKTSTKQVKINFKTRHVRFEIAGEEQKVLLDGSTCHPVKVDDCTWYKDDGDIKILLYKVKIGKMWDCAIKGHPQIDTSVKEKGQSGPGFGAQSPGFGANSSATSMSMENFLAEMKKSN